MLIQIDSNANIGCTKVSKHSVCPGNGGVFCTDCPLLIIIKKHQNGKVNESAK